MKKYICVKNKFISYHKYENAPQDVCFLKNLHRHLFYVTTKIQVFNDDRELEFFMVQNNVDKIIDNMNRVMNDNKSCEQMASFIITELQKLYSTNRYYCVEVSEDNENSAIVETV